MFSRTSFSGRGVLRAFIFTCIFVPGIVLIPMVIAVLLDRVENGFMSTFYRIVLLIPSMIPAPLIIILWVWLYNNYIGPINYFWSTSWVSMISACNLNGSPMSD